MSDAEASSSYVSRSAPKASPPPPHAIPLLVSSSIIGKMIPFASCFAARLAALGDLARYKMAVAAMVVGGADPVNILTADAVSAAVKSADPSKQGDLLDAPAYPSPKSLNDGNKRCSWVCFGSARSRASTSTSATSISSSWASASTLLSADSPTKQPQYATMSWLPGAKRTTPLEPTTEEGDFPARCVEEQRCRCGGNNYHRPETSPVSPLAGILYSTSRVCVCQRERAARSRKRREGERGRGDGGGMEDEDGEDAYYGPPVRVRARAVPNSAFLRLKALHHEALPLLLNAGALSAAHSSSMAMGSRSSPSALPFSPTSTSPSPPTSPSTLLNANAYAYDHALLANLKPRRPRECVVSVGWIMRLGVG
ncbi:hypothetical protein R3P38DRAFT_2791175 [Favolaschia claudopus]|uniref:Uncharacterized protein n=1 Tax=Favolaschia claudopus TaxID=2862362 RepID=A0AAW0AG79_9AGAR